MNNLEILIFLISFNIAKKKYKTKTPNRFKILNDFENLTFAYEENVINKHCNNIVLSNDKLLSKLQSLIFKKVNSLNDHENLKNLISNEIEEKYLNNVYEITNLWIYKKYV